MPEVIYGSSGDARLELGNPAEAEVSANLLDVSRRKATRLINVYVGSMYPDSIPVEVSGDVPLLLNSLANDLSTYFVKRAIHQGPLPLSDEIKEEYYDRSIEILEEIRDGTVRIPEFDGQTGNKIISSRSEYIPIFDVDSVENHVVDSNLEDKIADDRP